jgi:CubicO group peptidase (beta-lactamase class C family)
MKKPASGYISWPPVVFIVLLFITLLFGESALAQQPTAPSPGSPDPAPPQQEDSQLADPEELETFLDGIMSTQLETHNIPGATVSVVKDGEPFFAKGYGFADVERREPVVADETLFRMGSVNKLFTATAVMQLAEEGQLELETDVNIHLEDFQIPDTYPQPITLEHLLTHTAGFEEPFVGLSARNEEELRSLGEVLAEDMPARVRPPGELAAYSNYGMALAGYIVEQVSGMPFDRYVEENILEPLQMDNSTTRQPLPAELEDSMATGYTYENGSYEKQGFEFIQPAPAGSLNSTATDMSNFMIAHLQGGRYGEERILEEETAREMHARHFSHDRRINGMAYGFYEMGADRRIIGHDGDTNDFHTRLVLLRQADVGLLVSYSGGDVSTARDELLKAFLERYYPASDPTARERSEDFQERADRFAGSYGANRVPYTTPYKLAALGATLSVSPGEDGTLVTGSLGGGPQRWVEVEPQLFRDVDGEGALAFAEDGEGRITHMFVGDTPFMAFTKLAWHQRPTFHIGLLAICVALLLSAVIIWPVGVLLRWRRANVQRSRPVLSRVASWLAWGASALSIAFLAGFVVALRDPLEIEYGTPPLLREVLAVAPVIAVLSVGALIFTIPVWRGALWSLPGRVHYTLVTLAAVGFVWFLYYWNLLLGFWYS